MKSEYKNGKEGGNKAGQHEHADSPFIVHPPEEKGGESIHQHCGGV